MTLNEIAAKMTAAASQVTFGIEIECTIPAAAGIRPYAYHNRGANQLRVVGGTDATGAYLTAPAAQGHWHADADSSIIRSRADQHHVAVEFVSPVLSGEAGLAEAVAFVAWIKALGGHVNASCGLHIHIGAKSVVGQGASAAQLTEWARKVCHVAHINEQAIYAQTGSLARERGHYCQPLRESVRTAMRQAVAAAVREDLSRTLSAVSQPGRYQVVNTTNLFGLGTIEFRAFAGTLNPDKLLHALWTCIFLAVFAASLKRPTWTGNSRKLLTGVASVKLLHRKAAGAAQFGIIKERWAKARQAALKMAAKYDTAKHPAA